jgi:DNA-binding MarR family transcriptional regulator
MVDITQEWLNDRAWFDAYIAETTARPAAITQDELFILCLVQINPTRREIVTALGRSSGYVADRLDDLEFMGLVVNAAPGQARALVLTEVGREAIAGYTVIRENGNGWKLAMVENKETI